MFKMIISSIIISISLMMFFITHPLSMGLFILSQTFLICLISGMMIETYWFSYILFLIFLGGLLILFIYISSIASNEIFKFSMYKLFMMLFMMMTLTLIFFKINNKLFWLNFSINNDMNNLFNMFIFFNNENKINLSKLYNNHTYFFSLMLMIYLFITLIAVVKIINIFKGPIRSFN